MTPWTLARIEDAVRSGWGADTCEPAGRHRWHPGNPARGQSGATALVLHDLLGGDLLRGEVYVDGVRAGDHWWNRFAAGVEIDLTREQYGPEETVTPGRVVERPAELARLQDEYRLLRDRMLTALEPGGTDVTPPQG
ncbi:hypothetical protein [Kitasatospora sp. NPDC088346]|uniref:YunG family protein n=1 Tax=Kitasatospora sp. NPDC088346 TaxID=3364073 RepID=UPI00380F254B